MIPIVVSTCDKYSWILPQFFAAWYHTWPDCPYPFIVLGENSTEGTEWVRHNIPKSKNPHMCLGGRQRDWSSNMIEFLDWYQNRYLDQPFCLVLEDYMLVHVDRRRFAMAEAIIGYRTNIGQVRLIPCPGPTLPFRPGHHPEQSEFGTFAMNVSDPSYLLSLQAAMWRPLLLKDVLVAGESPWEAELQGSKRIRAKLLNWDCVGAVENIISYPELTKRGQIVPAAIDEMREKGIPICLPEGRKGV